MDKNKNKDEEIDFSIYLDELEEEEKEDEEKEVVSTPTQVEEKIKEETGTNPEVASKEKYKDPEKKEKLPFGKRFNQWWSNKKKWQKIVMIVCLVLLIVILVVGGFIWSKLSLMDTNGEDDFTSNESYEDDIDMKDMDGITDASSLTDFLMKWANNKGEKMHSKYVKNVLLIGTRDGLADSMILASLNESSKRINLVSFYRDSYTYIQPSGKKARFAKMNAAYSAGGAKCLIKTIEDDYKIQIDDYVVVDTNSFVKVVDALGGVDVNVTEKEANYLNTTWRQWTFTGNKVSYTSGVNHLNGEKALMFCRIRHLDSDINRTERQRRVITSVISKFKNSNVAELNRAVNALLPNVKTSMSKTEILSFAADAVSSGWLKYPLAQTTMPTTDTSKGGFVGDQWVWIVDYEGAAYQLQNMLYGKSNIKLEDGRVSVIGLKPTTSATVASTTKSHTTTKKAKVTTTSSSKTTTKVASTTTTVPESTTVEPTTETSTEPSTSNPDSAQTIRGAIGKILDAVGN